MMRVTPDVQETMARICKAYPQYVEYLRDAWKQELEQLPLATSNVAVAQGRCQALGELYRQLTNAPEERGKAYAAAQNAHR